MNNHSRILLVEDDWSQRNLIRDILSTSDKAYSIADACDGDQALQMISSNTYDIVLLDKRLPSIDGDEVCRRLRQDSKNSMLPVIMITAENGINELERSFSIGATDFIRKPYNPIELISRVGAALAMKRMTDQLDNAESLLFALARMVEAKDETTGDHCSRLSHRCVVFGKELGLSLGELEALRKGGIVHDIGKLAIPDSLLLKDSSLSDDEWVLMRQHTIIGAKLCEGLASMREVLPIILSHHERWDGTGYPYQLSGNNIPMLARVFQLVDVYDALSSVRPYKPAFSLEEILRIFQEEVDKGWRDPELTEYFMELLRSDSKFMEMPSNLPSSKDEEIFDLIASTGSVEWDRHKYS